MLHGHRDRSSSTALVHRVGFPIMVTRSDWPASLSQIHTCHQTRRDAAPLHQGHRKDHGARDGRIRVRQHPQQDLRTQSADIDEIQLLTQAASMVDGVYHMIYEELKPGVCENDSVALSNKLLYETGSDDVEAIKPGVTTDRVAGLWPRTQDFGFPNELSVFGLQFGHGLGLALHKRSIISRAVSFENQMEIRTGMVYALETCCPAGGGYSAARIEEEVVVSDSGCEVITLFPAEELPIANRY